jgi:hypothetical protein
MSLLLGIPILLVALSATSPLAVAVARILGASVPAWSMIVAAVGASARRKARYSLGLLLFVIVFGVAFLVLWQQLAVNSVPADDLRYEALVLAQQVVLLAAPIVTLLLFAGKRPSLFWAAG